VATQKQFLLNCTEKELIFNMLTCIFGGKRGKGRVNNMSLWQSSSGKALSSRYCRDSKLAQLLRMLWLFLKDATFRKSTCLPSTKNKDAAKRADGGIGGPNSLGTAGLHIANLVLTVHLLFAWYNQLISWIFMLDIACCCYCAISAQLD